MSALHDIAFDRVAHEVSSGMSYLQSTSCLWKSWAVMSVVITAIGIGTGCAADDNRSVWKESGESSQHYFRTAGGGVWYETDQGKVTFSFRETSRTPEAVNLVDASRDITIRLTRSQAEFLTDGGRSWSPLFQGTWADGSSISGAPLPPPADYRIRLIYFVPSDRSPTASYIEKIRTLMNFVADVYREDLQAKGYETRGPQFQREGGEIVVHLVKGNRPARYYNGHPRYDEEKQDELISKEIPESIFEPRSQVGIVFTEVYESIPAPFEWAGGIAHGSKTSDDSGCAFFSAWILQDEFCPTSRAGLRKVFRDTTPVPGRTAMGHGSRNSPRFEFVEDGMGAVIHELGHAVGLPHDYDPQSIMSSGFRDLRANVLQKSGLPKVGFIPESARMLMCHRHLNSALDHSDTLPPSCEAEFLSNPLRGATKLKVRVSLRDDKALRALLVVVENGGVDYVVAGQDLSGTEQSVSMDLKLQPLKPGALRVVVIVADQGGNHNKRVISRELGK